MTGKFSNKYLHNVKQRRAVTLPAVIFMFSDLIFKRLFQLRVQARRRLHR